MLKIRTATIEMHLTTVITVPWHWKPKIRYWIPGGNSGVEGLFERPQFGFYLVAEVGFSQLQH